EVAGHPPDDRQLLEVLLAEEREVGHRGAEQLGHDRGDTAEVAGPVGALQAFGELARHDVGLEPGRVDRGLRRGVDGVDAELLAGREVVLDRARIAVEVGRPVELQRITKIVTIVRSARALASTTSARWPSWRAPIVGTTAIVRPA